MSGKMLRRCCVFFSEEGILRDTDRLEHSLKSRSVELVEHYHKRNVQRIHRVLKQARPYIDSAYDEEIADDIKDAIDGLRQS